MKRIKVVGDLSKCGMFTEDLKTELGSIKVPRLVPIDMEFSNQISGLESISRSRRFSIIDKFYSTNPSGKSESLSGTLVDEKLRSLGAIFGLTLLRGGAVLIPRGETFESESVMAFAKLITRLWKDVNVTVKGADTECLDETGLG